MRRRETAGTATHGDRRPPSASRFTGSQQVAQASPPAACAVHMHRIGHCHRAAGRCSLATMEIWTIKNGSWLHQKTTKTSAPSPLPFSRALDIRRVLLLVWDHARPRTRAYARSTATRDNIAHRSPWPIDETADGGTRTLRLLGQPTAHEPRIHHPTRAHAAAVPRQQPAPRAHSPPRQPVGSLSARSAARSSWRASPSWFWPLEMPPAACMPSHGSVSTHTSFFSPVESSSDARAPPRGPQY